MKQRMCKTAWSLFDIWFLKQKPSSSNCSRPHRTLAQTARTKALDRHHKWQIAAALNFGWPRRKKSNSGAPPLAVRSGHCTRKWLWSWGRSGAALLSANAAHAHGESLSTAGMAASSCCLQRTMWVRVAPKIKDVFSDFMSTWNYSSKNVKPGCSSCMMIKLGQLTTHHLRPTEAIATRIEQMKWCQKGIGEFMFHPARSQENAIKKTSSIDWS